MVPCKCYLIKWLLTCVLFLLQEALVLTSCGIWHIWECCLHRGKCLSCCVSFQWLRSSPCSSYELDLSTSFLVTCYCHGTKPTVLLTYFEEKVAQLGGSLKALNFFPQLLMERKVMFWFLSLSCSVTDFCKHQTLVCVCVCVCESLSYVWLFVTPWTQAARLLYPWNFPGKNVAVRCHFLIQGIFPTSGSNLGLLHCRQILYHLGHQGVLNLSVGDMQQVKESVPCFGSHFWEHEDESELQGRVTATSQVKANLISSPLDVQTLDNSMIWKLKGCDLHMER